MYFYLYIYIFDSGNLFKLETPNSRMTCWNLQRNTRELRWHTSIDRYFSSERRFFLQEIRPELKHSMNQSFGLKKLCVQDMSHGGFLNPLDLKTKTTRRFFRYMPSKGPCLFLQCQYSMLVHVAHVSMQVFGLKMLDFQRVFFFFRSMSSQTRLIGRICVQCQGKCLMLCCTHVGFLAWHPVSWAHVYGKVASRISKTNTKPYLQATLVTLIISEMSMSVCRLWFLCLYPHPFPLKRTITNRPTSKHRLWRYFMHFVLILCMCVCVPF